jgi:hypothetical protein
MPARVEIVHGRSSSWPRLVAWQAQDWSGPFVSRRIRGGEPANGEARIEDALAGAAEETVAAAAPRWRHSLPWLLAALTFLLGLWTPWRPAPQLEKPQRMSIQLGADASLVMDSGPAAVLSSDGSVLAFVARKAAGGAPELYVRRLDQLQGVPLA